MQGTARDFWLLDCGGRRCRALGGAPEHVSLQLTGRPVPASSSRVVGRLMADETPRTAQRHGYGDTMLSGAERNQREGPGWELSSDPVDRTGGPTLPAEAASPPRWTDDGMFNCLLSPSNERANYTCTRRGRGEEHASREHGARWVPCPDVPPWRSRVCPAAVVSVVSASTGPRSRITEPVLAGNFQSLNLPSHSAELYLEAEYANAGL
ncbi:hypothetical protein CMUS01_12369 [Colletotrichum musicola]|uniref:Uncharacterized protein n=1 Tax=Colletotrichum musicola TaxID=2175873 RepID=A0A8H6JNG4_9PEZI|nr:hypothetical protein CMUS01_12369 [Colletotrichum musicola]